MGTTSSEPNGSLPRLFGHLTLLKVIARGGMGEVYLAYTGGIEGAERPCVVKMIRREHAEQPSFVARFLDEARVQAQLQHPGVAQILEAGRGEGGNPFVVVEYVEGRSLAEVRARAAQTARTLTWAESLSIAMAIAEALAHVHERVDAAGRPLHIVHRDLSPQNVMVGYGGEIKLIDFGTARGENRRSRTVSGVVYAKPGYVAPEVANNIPGEAPADIYALGVMTWELCAGRRFLQGDSGEHMAAVGANQRPLPPIAAVCGAPPELDNLLAKMTAFGPSSRPSARQIASELGRMLSRAPALHNGERGQRARVASLCGTLFPSEPNRSRSEFQRLVYEARKLKLDSQTLASSESEKLAKQAAESKDENMLFGTRFRLRNKLGEGACGIVYEAEHVDLGRPVALKVLSPEQAAKPDSVERFRREARAVSRVSHPAIVKLYDFGKAQDGRLFLAMEFSSGETIEQRLERSPSLSVEQCVSIAKQAAEGLHAVHSAGIVHRDIKPSNLILLRDGSVKIIDFGVAYIKDETQDTKEANEKVILYGTPEYMAPEQFDHLQVDGRADIYALGSVLYEMLTGVAPFGNASGIGAIERKRRTIPEIPSKKSPHREIPQALDAAIMKALASNPSERFASAAEFAITLEQSLLQPKPTPNKRRIWVRAVASVVLSVAMVGAISASVKRQGGSLESVVEQLKRLSTSAIEVISGNKSQKASPEQIPELATAPQSSSSTVVDLVPAPPPISSTLPATQLKNPSQTKATPEQIKQMRTKAKKATGQKQWSEVKKIAESWAQIDDSHEPQMFMAKALANLGHLNEAKTILKNIIEIDPNFEEAKQLLKNLEHPPSAKVTKKGKNKNTSEKSQHHK